MKQAKILTKAEYMRVMAVLDSNRHAIRNRTMFALSFFAGLRACEIAGLKVGDVYDVDGMYEIRFIWIASRQKGTINSKSLSANKCKNNCMCMQRSTTYPQSNLQHRFCLAVRAVGLVHKQSSICFLVFTARLAV